MMIKLANSSDLGWKIAQEYQRCPIADDSEDENIMIGAISKAERKTKSEKAKMRRRTTPYSKYRWVEYHAGKNKPGRCFTCGKRGHWADSCPDSKQSKISTFLSFFNIGLNLD